MYYQIYVDEAGNTPYYNDDAQPVSAWGGVITNRSEGDFDKEVRFLLKEFGLPEETEFHVYEVFQNKGPFEFLSNENRELILFKFLSIGIQYIDYYCAVDDLNNFRTPDERLKFESRNLSILERLLFVFITKVDFYLHFKLNAKYSLYFDESGDFYKRKRLISHLSETSLTHYYLRGLKDEPFELNSNKNRFIQLADVICDNGKKLALLTKTFTGRNKFIKHEAFIKNCHQIIKSKEMPFTANLEFFENSNDQKVIEFNKMCNDWETRDFSTIPNLLSKKKKSDIFNHSVNTFWEEMNNNFNLIKTNIEKISGNEKQNTDKLNGLIQLEVFSQFCEIFIMRNKEYSFLPEFEEIKQKIKEHINKILDVYNLSQGETCTEAIEKAEEILKQLKLIPLDETNIINSLGNDPKQLIHVLAPYIIEVNSLTKQLNSIFLKIDSAINPGRKKESIEIYYVEEQITKEIVRDSIQEYNECVRLICEKLTMNYERNLPFFLALPNEIEVELTYQKVYLEKTIIAMQKGICEISQKLDSFHRFISGFRFTNKEIAGVVSIGTINNSKIKELLDKINVIIKRINISKKSLKQLI